MDGHFLLKVQQIHESALRITLNSGVWYQDGIVMGVHQQSCIHKLIWKKRAVVIGEISPQLDGSGGGVDLVVQRFESSGGQLLRLCAIERVHNQPLALLQLMLDLR